MEHHHLNQSSTEAFRPRIGKRQNHYKIALAALRNIPGGQAAVEKHFNPKPKEPEVMPDRTLTQDLIIHHGFDTV